MHQLTKFVTVGVYNFWNFRAHENGSNGHISRRESLERKTNGYSFLVLWRQGQVSCHALPWQWRQGLAWCRICHIQTLLQAFQMHKLPLTNENEASKHKIRTYTWKSPIEHTGNGKKGNTKYLIRYKQNVIFFQNSLYLHKCWDVGLSIYIFMYQQYKQMNTHRKRWYVPFYLDIS